MLTLPSPMVPISLVVELVRKRAQHMCRSTLRLQPSTLRQLYRRSSWASLLLLPAVWVSLAGYEEANEETSWDMPEGFQSIATKATFLVSYISYQQLLLSFHIIIGPLF